MFHALTEAADLLLDPAKRAEFDKKHAAEKARRERFSALDKKRKADVADLEARESEFKRAEMEKDKKAGQAREVERLKEEAVRLRAQRQQKAEQAKDAQRDQQRQSAASTSQPSPANGVIDLGPLDTTLILTGPQSQCPDSDTLREAICKHAPASAIDNIVLSAKKSKKQTAQQTKAVVSFSTLAATIATYKAASKAAPGLEGMDVKWASGEPPQLARRALGLDETSTKTSSTNPSQKQSHVRTFSCYACITADAPSGITVERHSATQRG